MSAEPETLNRETAVIRGSRLSLERDRTDPLFRSSLKSSGSTVGIASGLNHNGRVQATSVSHPAGADVIENGIDLIRGSDLNRALAFTGMESEPTVGTCAICERPLTQIGPKGECLRCLADLGFLSGSREPGRCEAPRRLTPGPLKYDHFEVEVGADGFPIELGSGAIAITYRARDTVLNSVVALKVIDRRVAKMPGVRSRFLREARAAAQIRHPNVARVTHYGEQDGECFYVMELVEGKTLEARVRRDGPMPLAQALEVIEQTARALAAAEACGVVHRDIKPSNIMLESDPGGGAPIVKVIDYGIAKILNPEMERGAEKTQPGFIGTPAFASPEQFAPSQQMKIDARSDIYSLGATFWYLLSGRVPFVGRTLREVAEKQAEELPLEQLKNTNVPARVIALLQSMLTVDPAKRPQTARELLSAIHRCYTKFSTEARARRKRSIIVAAGAILVLGAVAFGTWLYERVQSSAETERSIAVLPFENLSPDSEDTYFTVGMQDEITGDLAKLAGMRVIGSQSTRSYLPGKERNLHAIGRDLGVRHLLEGTVSKDNNQMRVALHLVDLRNGAIQWAATYQRPLKEVFALQSEITQAVATQLKARLSPNEKTDVDTPPTNDLRAYDLYLQARNMPSVTLNGQGGQFYIDAKRAIPMLQEAVARDPNFALAYCELARWHDDMYYQRNVGPAEERAVDHRRFSEAALEKARRAQPDSGVVHLALARHALQINSDVEEAEVQIQLARTALPNSAQVEGIAGRVARRQDRWDDALKDFERAVSLEPRSISLGELLLSTYRFVRRYRDFDRVWDTLRALTPADQAGTLYIERAWAHLEEAADLSPIRETLLNQKFDESNTTIFNMMLAVWSRDVEGMTRILSKKHDPIGWNGVIFPDAWFEALAARIRGDNDAAVKAFEKARPFVEQRVLADPSIGLDLSVLAIIDAALGHKELAVQEGRKACDLDSTKTSNFLSPAIHSNLAVVYAWTSQNDHAIAELNALLSGGGKSASVVPGGNRPAPTAVDAIAQPTYGDFRLNPLWDPLRNDPRFTAMMNRLAPVVSK
jgi:serine/threonine protein kinase